MTIIAKSKFLEFKSAKSPSGNDWYYTKRTNDSKNHDSAVVITTIININSESYFLFIKTRRPPIYSEGKAEFCIESPAGLIGDINSEETLEQCIQKELMEETGLMASKIYIELENSSTSAGLSSETLTFVTAITNNYNIINPTISDGGIIAERFLVPVKDIRKYLFEVDKKNCSVAAPTICGIFFALSRI